MILSYILMTLLFITSILLMIIILLQRGRGGGLAGAFGGLGGQSAFGTKAGDVFTKITIGLAIFWIFLAGVSSLALERDSQRRFKEEVPPQGNVQPADEPVERAPAEKPLPPVGGDDAKKKSAEPAGAAADAKTKDEKKQPEKPAEAKDQPPADAKDSAPAKKDGGKTGEQTEKK
ncbi:MAG: preprotein translocase subunit SecG [Planctomycetaceae bacterium]